MSCHARPKTALAGPQGALQLEWPSRAVLSWTKMIWPISLWVGFGRGMTLGNMALFSQDSSVARMISGGESWHLRN